MLVLTRHRGESIIVGDDCIVTVLAISGDRVRLGFDAPSQLRIDREEVRAIYPELTRRVEEREKL
jgi:carbon storage regulator